MPAHPFGHPDRALRQRRKWGFALAALALTILFAPLPQPAAPPANRLIRIEASRFQFSPSQVILNPGDRVTVELVSTDVVHGFSLDGYPFTLTADPGQTATGTFVADRSGVFRFRCTAPCGNLHPFMIGKLQVGPNVWWVRGILLGILAIGTAFWSVKVSSFTPTGRSV